MCVLEGPVVTPPRASRRLQKVQTKAGAKRAASVTEVDVTSRPKKILRSQSQRQQSVIITEHHGGYIAVVSLKIP